MDITVHNILESCFALNYGFSSAESKEILGLIRHAITLGDSKFKQIISDNIINIRNLPHDIANLLAHEDLPISLRILQNYDDFNERELTDLIVLIQDPKKLIALAKRTDLSEAQLDILHRKNIMVNTEPQNESEFSNEDLLIDLTGLKRNIDNLFLNNKLSSLIVINFLCKGDIFSFTYALSRLSEIPQKLIYQKMEYPSSEDFKDIFITANIPLYYFDAIALILRFINKNYPGAKVLPSSFRSDLYNFIKTNQYSSIENMKYLMQLIKNSK